MDLVTLALAKNFTTEEIGKVDERVTKIEDLSPFTYKGSVPSYADLPADAKKGETYTIEDTGDEYVYGGNSWIKLGNNITDYDDLTNQPIKNLALSMTEATMLIDIVDGCYIITERGNIQTTSGKVLNFEVGTELMIATYSGIKSGIYQTGKAVASFNDNMTASEKSFTWLNTSHKDLQITENASDSTIPTSKAVKDYVDNLVNSALADVDITIAEIDSLIGEVNSNE